MFSAIRRFLYRDHDSGAMVWIIIVVSIFGFFMETANDSPKREQACSKAGNLIAIDRTGDFEKMYIIGKCDPKTGTPTGKTQTFQKYGRG